MDKKRKWFWLPFKSIFTMNNQIITVLLFLSSGYTEELVLPYLEPLCVKNISEKVRSSQAWEQQEVTCALNPSTPATARTDSTTCSWPLAMGLSTFPAQPLARAQPHRKGSRFEHGCFGVGLGIHALWGWLELPQDHWQKRILAPTGCCWHIWAARSTSNNPSPVAPLSAT